jgi:hypothetical protein
MLQIIPHTVRWGDHHESYYKESPKAMMEEGVGAMHKDEAGEKAKECSVHKDNVTLRGGQEPASVSLVKEPKNGES